MFAIVFIQLEDMLVTILYRKTFGKKLSLMNRTDLDVRFRIRTHEGTSPTVQSLYSSDSVHMVDPIEV